VNLPGFDGIQATREIMATAPASIVMMSAEGDSEYLRRAMQAGARDYLKKPFTIDELTSAIGRAETLALPTVAPSPAGPKQARVITVFGTKGGVGRTTVAANLAVALSMGGHRVAALDLDLEFGSLATLMGCRPGGTIYDLARLQTVITPEHVQRVAVTGTDGKVQVVAAPPLPQHAAEVEGDARADRSRQYVAETLDAMRKVFDYVVVDTAVGFRESNLLAFDRSDRILIVATPEIPSLAATCRGLDLLLNQLEVPKEKIQVVINRADTAVGLTLSDVTKTLGQAIRYEVPSDGEHVIYCANAGRPVVLTRGNFKAAQALRQLANSVLVDLGEQTDEVEATTVQPTVKPTWRGLWGLLGGPH
jgi:pilus assembly protein CpaE